MTPSLLFLDIARLRRNAKIGILHGVVKLNLLTDDSESVKASDEKIKVMDRFRPPSRRIWQRVPYCVAAAYFGEIGAVLFVGSDIFA